MADLHPAQLYRAVAQISDDALVVRMRQQGFWPEGAALPEDPPEEVAQRAAILQEISELRRSASAVKNPEKALAIERKRRWEESKKRRAENKKLRTAERERRREEYNSYKTSHVINVGARVSALLQDVASDVPRLQARGLPPANDGPQLAALMGITLPGLRWLTFHRRGATLVHYRRFTLPKKAGGVRCISAPRPALASAQRWVLEHILAKLAPEPQAHGFVPTRSIVSNAMPHVGKTVVLNLDLKEFFPSINFRRVRGLFHALGYSQQVATLLALLCTEPPRVAAEVDGKTYHVALGERVLPQGACTSPALTNLLCWRLDRRLAGLAQKHGFAYTRYADDLTFSGANTGAVGRLMRSIRSIVGGEGFTEHPTKSRVMRSSSRQEVTGVTVNTRPTIARAEMRKLRAILYNVAKTGLASQNHEERADFAAYLRGRVAFIEMVDPKRGADLRRALNACGG